jgi:immune inhibitor A
VIDKRIEKPVTDKSVGLDKNFDGKFSDKLADGGFPGGGGRPGLADGGEQRIGVMEQRLVQLESMLAALMGQLGQAGYAAPFIGQELRPDLSQGALADEEDGRQNDMRNGVASGKRSFDTKSSDV